MSNLVFSLNTTMPVFLMMVLGFFLHQVHIIDDGFASKLNKFVLFYSYSRNHCFGLVLVVWNTFLAGAGRIRSGGVSKQCGDPGYRLYAEHVRRCFHGSADDHRKCSSV